MKTLFIVFALLLATGCASLGPAKEKEKVGQFEVVSPAEYCEFMGERAESFIKVYRDQGGLKEENVHVRVEILMEEMVKYNQDAYDVDQEKLKKAFAVIRKERRALHKAVEIAFSEPRKSPEEAAAAVNDACVKEWGGKIWYSLFGKK